MEQRMKMPQDRKNLPLESLVDAEMAASTGWLIRLRWLAGIGVLGISLSLEPIFGLRASTIPLAAIGGIILVYNILFNLTFQRLQSQQATTHSYYRLTLWQVMLDWLMMAVLIYFSGGIESPVIFFFIFHIVIASMFFSQKMAFALTLLAILLVTAIGLLEYYLIIPHQSVVGFLDAPQYKNPLYVTAVLVFFGITSIFVVYLVSTITVRLRERERQVVQLSEGLRRASARLRALNEAALTMSSTLELEEVLNRLVKSIAEVLDVRACSIRLLDATGKRLEPVATYGLSQEYIDKGPIDLDVNPLAREVLAGRVVNIPDVSQSLLLQYPEWAKQEGIHSMLSAALVGKDQPIGILRVYSAEVNKFTKDDETFLTSIAAQGSIAIENAMAYQAMEQLDAMKSTFIRTATHELRSPVSVTRSLLRSITAGYVGELNPQQSELLERAIRRIDFLRGLVDDLLELAEGKTQNMVYKAPVPVILDEVIHRVFSRYAVPAEEKQLTLELQDLSETSCSEVLADPDSLDRIFNNLVSNAVKYTQAGGKVTVTIAKDDSQARVTVADTGIGIPEEALPHLFEEFYRAPNAKKIEQEGTGLGLTIVKDAVTRLGGEISVKSKLGEGTVFTVLLPLVSQPETVSK
jgi:signal transduction histidine kinase